MVALVPTIAGVVLRGAFYFGTLDECNWEVHVGFGTIFSHRAARLARHVSVGAYCVLGQVHIGAGAKIGSHVSVPSGKRQHLNRNGELCEQGSYDTVRIGEQAWIGDGAIVVADVGHHCIVGAGAVVSDPVPPMRIAVGNPARMLDTKVKLPA
ncbi:MAG: acyltransferase [Rhodocyclales bacterium]|nr:acyltransferase [Rhodocyclales bacterium]